MIKKIGLSIVMIMAAFIGVAETLNGTVTGIVSIGTEEYCFISEDGTSNVYKTSPFTAGELLQNQAVELTRTRIDNQVKVTAETLTSSLYAMLEVVTAGQSIYYPDMSRMPVQVGDILFFEDEAHITEVHDMVTLFLDDDTYRKETDTKLDEIEHNEYPTFISFRTNFQEKHNLLTGVFTEGEIEAIEKADFINDDIHKTFFNKYRFMGVGNKIYYFHDINMTLVFDADDSETLALIETVSEEEDDEGYDVLNIESQVMELVKGGKIKFNSPFHTSYGKGGNKGIGVVNPNLSYQTIPDFGGVSCQPYKKQLAVPELYEVIINFPNPGDQSYESYWGQSSVTLTITWGDGTPDQVITNYEGEYITHDYPSGVATTWYPTTKMTFVNSNGTITDVFDGTNVSMGHDIEFQTYMACTDANAEAWGEATSGSWKMTTKIWTYHNWLGHQVGSRTWSYKNQNGWGLRSSTIATFITGIYRNADCIQQETKSGNKNNNSSRKVQKTKNKLWADYSMGNGDITSYHTLNKAGTSIALSMTLNPCQ